LNPPATSVDDSGANDRLEEPERLPEEIDDDTLRKYFTLTESDLEQVAQCRVPPTGWDLLFNFVRFGGGAISCPKQAMFPAPIATYTKVSPYVSPAIYKLRIL
jgi:hypothetical protein